MLTELQRKKLTHYFNVLDFDKSGTLEKQDFVSIGVNLSTLWGFGPDTAEYQASTARTSRIWSDFHSFINKGEEDHATLEEWLEFADRMIVNGSEEMYVSHVSKVAMEIIDLFDADKDGYLSLSEYLNLFMAYRIEIKHSTKAFANLDKNHDDLISKEELLLAIREFFRSDDEDAAGNWLFGFWEHPRWV
ncbi:MAG: hypothetical protein CMB80_14840 [Flammeovirgaceae bacterium]|nr:hypothetical protein [Flammeovirgaceae bacterium]MBE63526.1 hypothetical protein [Flammeovirgaceae bacterium]MBR08689.1 hypothetical protein [Rickettsiales bacterium]HCX23133.1 hypothetical protein [Cytophagales bacterium]|tara:strand:- start:3640 stop:4209 length:570 start_codon:yes stop_codon:yes gene_type:complete